MKKDRIKILLIVSAVFFLIILAGFQIAFLNRFDLGLNVFLVLVLFLILNKNTYGAFFLGWLGGLLIDTVHFSVFGTSSLILLLLAAFLVIFQKKALITAKTEGVLLIGVTAVFFYRFFEWLVNILLISGRETLYFYFFNMGFLDELLFTVALLLIIFYFRNKSVINNV